MADKKNTLKENIVEFWVHLATPLAIVLSIVIAVLIISAMYDGPVSKSSPAGRFLYDYQTICAGILAIFASFFTVSQMRRSDIKQEQRHQEIQHFNLRHDKRVVFRAHSLIQNDLISTLTQWEKFARVVDNRIKTDAFMYFLTHPGGFVSNYKITAQVFDRRPIKEVISLLNIAAYNSFDQSLTCLLSIKEACELFETMDQHLPNKEIEMNYRDWFNEEFDNFSYSVRSAHHHLNLFVNEIEKMKHDYEKVHDLIS